MAKREAEQRIRKTLDQLETNDRVRMQTIARLVEMVRAKPELLTPEIKATILERTETVKQGFVNWSEFLAELRRDAPGLPGDIVARIEAHRDRAKWMLGQMEAIQ